MRFLIISCLTIFIANMAFAQCPAQESQAETELLFNEGPIFVNSISSNASACLRKIINDVRRDNPGNKMDDRELVQNLMNARWKAEVFENDINN